MQASVTILIVDDSEVARTSYRGLLEQDSRCSYQVLEATSVREALEVCDRALPDLILLDYQLPEKDGLVLLQEWQIRYGSIPAPVIMLTGKGSEQVAVDAMKQGAQDYLVKGPLTAEQLSHTVHSVLEKLRLIDQLEKKHKQQQLLATVSLRIRQSLDLETVLQTAVSEVLQLLQVDRVLIYQVLGDNSGAVINEAILPNSDQRSDPLFSSEACPQEFCLSPKQSLPYIISSVEQADLSPCLMSPSKLCVVQAKLIVPILQSDGGRETPWGLIIVHQCRSPRQWQDWEVELMQQLADQLAIAIQQSELYERVQAELYERVQAELRDKQRVAAEFRALVESAPDIIYRIDVHLRYLYFNPAIEKVVHQPVATLLGKTPVEIGVSEDIAGLWQQLVDRLVRTRSEETIEHPFPDLHSSVWFQTRIVPEFNEAGEVCSFLCIARDISQLKAMERELQLLNQELEIRVEQRTTELQESQRFAQNIADSIPNVLYIHDLDEDRNIYTNHIGSITLGYSPAQIQEMGPFLYSGLMHPHDRERSIHYFQQLRHLADQERRSFEYRLRHANGEWRWYLSYDTVFRRRPDGQVQSIIGTAQDITARKQMEEQLHHLTERLTLALQSGGFGIWEYDFSHPKQIWDDRMYELYGVSRESFPGTMDAWLACLHPDDRNPVLRIMEEVLSQHQEYNTEFRVIHPNGTVRFLKAYGLLQCNEQNQPVRMIGINYDITDLKTTEETLRQVNEQLAHANVELTRATRLKDEFLANMSHELRTPLNAILGLSEILQDNIFGSMNDRQVNAIRTIERSGRHLLELISDILDLSKIAAGKLELKMSQVFAKNLCENSLAFVRQMALQKQIQLSFQSDISMACIQADDLRLRQALINLLSNAIKFTPERGSVTLTVSRQPATAQDWENLNFPPFTSWVLFSVQDTGIGIDPEHLGKLFQPFVQIDSSLNRQYTGTGLGLALVRRIAELHGGSVTVRTERGQGSCFTLKIPDRVPPELVAEKSLEELSCMALGSDAGLELAQAVAQSPLILLAEDNEANVMTVSTYLEGCGYRLILATNGEEAISLARSHHPNLILMDIQMPGMDGLEATRQIRQIPELAALPIIALTALAMPGDQEKCLAAGANAYLTKPISLKLLVAQIRQMIDR